MTSSRDIARVVAAIDPWDALERQHQTLVLRWLRSTTDVFRRSPPRTPPQHLVAYVILQDPADRSILLVDHRRSGLVLPAGGHVEPHEDPADCARREAFEELGVVVTAGRMAPPLFVTMTETLGAEPERHVDVSLWYVIPAAQRAPLCLDGRELVEARWWSRAEIAAADRVRLEPHISRFVAKLDARATAAGPGVDEVSPAPTAPSTATTSEAGRSGKLHS